MEDGSLRSMEKQVSATTEPGTLSPSLGHSELKGEDRRQGLGRGTHMPQAWPRPGGIAQSRVQGVHPFLQHDLPP